jgi:hypothetical protein
MSRQWQMTSLIVVLAVFGIPSTSVGVWDDDIWLFTSPPLPTDEDVFDLDAGRSFPDAGYFSIDQSISVNGNEIDVWALIQDQHTRPNAVFAQHLTWCGAFFNDFGPLAAGTYEVNVHILLTPWPATSGGELIDEETLQFTVTSAVPEPGTILLLVPAIAFGFIRRRTFERVSKLTNV